MPSFTLELWRVLDGKAPSKTEDQELRLDAYPIFDETYRIGLNTKIKNHFMYREIGQETVEQFTFMLGRKMNEIMPYYNQLYLSERIVFDPLSTVDMSTLTTGTGHATAEDTATSEQSSTGESKAKTVNSAFPQMQLQPDKDYASSGADSISDTTNSGTGTNTSNSTNDSSTSGDTHTTGYQGPATDLLMRFRDTFLNIDMQIIAELEPLFMQIWNTDDSYTTRQSSIYFPYAGRYGY